MGKNRNKINNHKEIARQVDECKKLLDQDKTTEYINILEKLDKKYPNNPIILFNLASVLIKCKKSVSKALLYYGFVMNDSNRGYIINDRGRYYLDCGKYDEAEAEFRKLIAPTEDLLNKCRGYHGLIMTYIHMEFYQPALDYLNYAGPLFIQAGYDLHSSNVRFFLRKMLGEITEDYDKFPEDEERYFARQVILHDDNRAINHIVDSFQAICPTYNMSPRSMFYVDENVEELYNQAKEQIKNMEPKSRRFVDYYQIDLGRQIGFAYNDSKADALEITTLPNSKDILSIQPINSEHVYMGREVKKYTIKNKNTSIN